MDQQREEALQLLTKEELLSSEEMEQVAGGYADGQLL